MRRFIMMLVVAVVAGITGATISQYIATGQEIAETGDVARFTASEFPGTDPALCTTSTAFVDIPGAPVTFVQRGQGRAVIMFQARWLGQTSNAGRIRIRPVIDSIPEDIDQLVWTLQTGSTAENPVQISGTSGTNFITDTLNAGPHIVTIQWRSQFGQEVCVGRHIATVLHR